MDKNEFLHILKDPEYLKKYSFEDLKHLAKQYSYSSLLHILLAKYMHQNNLPEQEKYIQLASSYALDRKILKQFITETEPKIDILKEEVTSTSEKCELSNSDTVMDLKNESVESHSDNGINTEKESMKNAPDSPPASHHFSDENNEIESEPTATPEKAEEQTEKAPLVIIDNTSNVSRNEEEFINYLNSLGEHSEERTEYERSIKKDQDELIERFIKSRPSLIRASPQKTIENQQDLSEPSIATDDNLVSENLAIIMAKQGKIEKAIDIYKKLIWKYPQKKSYFADRIEELKK